MAADESPTYQLHKGSSYHSDVNIGEIVNVTAATLTILPETHGHKYVTLDLAAGQAVTLPAATGTGDQYTFYVETDITTAGSIKCSVAADLMAGFAIIGEADTAPLTFHTTAGSDTIAMDGSATGGLQGDMIVLTDISSGIWQVTMIATASTTATTPFDATVT